MLVFGAIDFAAAVARVGKFLGYRVTVCDARPVFATRSRFPEADEVVVDWPHRYLAAESSRSHRPAHRASACSPTTRSSTCRCSRSRCAPTARPATSARWAPAARTTTGWPGCARQGSTRRSWPAVLADRAGHRRAHPGGDRGLDRRRDRRAPLGRHRRAAGRHRGSHPPRRLTRGGRTTTTANWPVARASLMVSGTFCSPCHPVSSPARPPPSSRCSSCSPAWRSAARRHRRASRSGDRQRVRLR